MECGAATRWTTVNFGEAATGVQKPLGWAMWDLSMEASLRRTFYALGVFSRAEVPTPRVDKRMSGIFYGRIAGNVDAFRRAGDRIPGSSGDILEEKLFGSAPPPGGPTRKPFAVRRRYPVIALKMPRAAVTALSRLPAVREEYRSWWQDKVLDSPPRDVDGAQALYRDAADRFIAVAVYHGIVSMIGSTLLDTLADLAERSGNERSMGALLATGYGSMEETELIRDIWLASEGRMTSSELIRRHGYHGRNEGDLSELSWREDPAAIDELIGSYTRSKVSDPHDREAHQRERRLKAEEQVLSGLPIARRPAARLTMRLAGRFICGRELGKASFLHTLDAARCAARILGELHVERGVLADPADVFFLTGDEFLQEPDDRIQDRVDERRAHHVMNVGLDLPPSWAGNPVPIPIVGTEKAEGDHLDAGEPNGEIHGIGVVGERVTGRARVVDDPSATILEPGDILVCKTTDPSWTPLFMLADALVIDTGGGMSHGAIVARELGVTCVINTVTGTRDIPGGGNDHRRWGGRHRYAP